MSVARAPTAIVLALAFAFTAMAQDGNRPIAVSITPDR